MNGRFRAVVLAAAVAGLFSVQALGAGKQSLTGQVSDSMCGKKHMEGPPPAECTRACISHGSKYALVVGDKVYVLNTTDKAALATLDKQAGKNATVTGSVDGDNVEVSSVTAAK